MATTTVTPGEVADRLGRPRPADGTPQFLQWQVWIDQAVTQITRYQRLRNLPDPDPADVDFVVLEVVAAMVMHPDDSTQVSVSIDDGSTSRTYKSGSGSIAMDNWWDYLWSGQGSDGAFSVRPSYQPDRRGCW